jgi:hypothetical protein
VQLVDQLEALAPVARDRDLQAFLLQSGLRDLSQLRLIVDRAAKFLDGTPTASACSLCVPSCATRRVGRERCHALRALDTHPR